MYPIEHPCCSICTTEYSDSLIPRLLPACGHTFCQTCIRKMSVNYTVKCPFDEKISVYLRTSTLQKNYEIIRIVEEIKRIKRKRRTDSCVTPKLNIRCHENPHHAAEMHCADCRADLCKDCSNKVHKFKLFGGHKITNLCFVDNKVVNCPVHRFSEAKLKCSQYLCSAPYRIGCKRCFQNGDHAKHSTLTDMNIRGQENVTTFYVTPMKKTGKPPAPTPPMRSCSLPPPPSIRVPSIPRDLAGMNHQQIIDDFSSEEDSHSDAEEPAPKVDLPQRVNRPQPSIKDRVLGFFSRRL